MLTIRSATFADIPLIRRLAEEAFPATYRPILSAEQLAWMMEWMYAPESLRRQMEEGHTFYLAAWEGEPCGYLSIEQQEERLFHLQKIYLLPAFQGRGIGRRLFDEAQQHIRRLGALPARIELNVNRHNPALGFYERMGMTRLRTVDIPIGEGFYMNDYIMGIEVSNKPCYDSPTR